jgi:hypothetical protein
MNSVYAIGNLGSHNGFVGILTNVSINFNIFTVMETMEHSALALWPTNRDLDAS